MANWAGLPQDVLELIARRLAIEDYLSFGRVCTSWRSAAAAAKEAYKAKSKAPWLMTHVGERKAEFFSPSGGRIFQLLASRVQTMSPSGWLLVSNGDRDSLFNPLSGIRIELPTLEKRRHKSGLTAELGLERLQWDSPGIKINKIALSSSPSLSRSYTVMSYSFSSGFAFHKSGEDAWTVVSRPTHLPRFHVHQLIYYNGLFVALDACNRIMTLNERKCRMQLRLVLREDLCGCPYLVECSSSLLVAWTTWNGESITNIRVSKVDLENRTHQEVKSLGNASLFLNAHSSSSFSVEFDAESCLPGIKPNHIYFMDLDDEKKSYNMDDGKVETFNYAISRDNYAVGWLQPDF
ncbi:F-box protein At2g16300 [Rhodamnia argentea]|uniref:F-box protein At2g16300 n=1 Tax=Rhodamnia argentea TaxID=178133 RepID=A0A8B8MUC7_9MYRT|nr:F-box protein At2g16300 [Rhodamnia argentea]